MIKRTISILAVVFLSGCAAVLPPQPPPSVEQIETKPVAITLDTNTVVDVDSTLTITLAADSIQRLGSEISLCDAPAIADRSTDWTCAGYVKGYKAFIDSWESTANSSSFRKQYPLRPISDWKYFNENDEIDFYAKAYQLKGVQVLIAHDPSESGREIFIGISPNIGRLMDHANGQLDKNREIKLASNRSKLEGSYNCSDFKNHVAAKTFFAENNFTAEYDPYNLDADNNGIPCESFRAASLNTGDSSKCPPGKSWVAPYTRSNGSSVRGHCRKKR